MADYGKFDMGENEICEELWQLFEDEIMENMDLTNMEVVSSIENVNEMKDELLESAFTCLPPPETPAAPKRFKSFTENDLKQFEDARQSKSTKMNTKWAIKLFQGRPR